MSRKGGRVEAEPLPRWLKGCRGRRMEAQWSPQWSLNGRYWSAKGGTMVVQGRQKRRSNWYIMFTTVRLYLRGDQWRTTVRPFCDHGDVCAFLQPPLSDLCATELLGDLCATVLNMLKTSRRPWRPWQCLNVLCTTLERPRQPFCLRPAFNGDLASYVVVQERHKGRSPCVKGVLRNVIPLVHNQSNKPQQHDDVIKWKNFPRYWPFVRGILRSLVNSLICAWIHGWVKQWLVIWDTITPIMTSLQWRRNDVGCHDNAVQYIVISHTHHCNESSRT